MATEIAATSVDSPFVGPKTFTREQGGLYFGREREADELFARVLSERLVLFYAQSGAGKSSLVNTRLIPRLEREGFAVLPVARVSGTSAEPAGDAANPYLLNLMRRLDDSGVPQERYLGLTLSRFLAGLCSDDGRRFHYDWDPCFVGAGDCEPVGPSTVRTMLIVDQFEEFISAYPDRWAGRDRFFRELNQAMLDDPNLWVLLVFREDFLAPIEPFAPLMADRFRARFYMERMGEAAAVEAVRRPAELGGRPFAHKVAEELVTNLRQVRVPGQRETVAGQYVEPVQLQVVCLQLWKNIQDRPLGPIGSEDLKNAGDITRALVGFYEAAVGEVVSDLGGQVSERKLRAWFERELITPDETRALVRQGDNSTADLPNAAVKALLDRFVVRSDSRAGDIRIELVHDRLVQPILESNRAWRSANRPPMVLEAELWMQGVRSPQGLLSGERLRSALAELEAARSELSAQELRNVEDLLEASQAQDRKRDEMALLQRLALLEREKYISEMGWGIIFPAVVGADEERDAKQREQDAIVEALRPLLDHRRSEATLKHPDLYREIKGAGGYRPGESADAFLVRHKVGPGEVDPLVMPRYLLLIGDPEAIPFEFQYQLDLQFSVGRIHFDELDDFRQYAESVVRAETGASPRPRRVAVFAPANPTDQATNLMARYLAGPLIEHLEEKHQDWGLTDIVADLATKARLKRVLGGDETPALLFSASHTMDFPLGSPRQLSHQGAILCQDWPGPGAYRGPIPKSFYFSADDLGDDADVFGLVCLGFGGHDAGTPRLDNFFRQAFNEQRPIAERSFLARLPLRLLAHPKGSALAFIAHVERAWIYSFRWQKAGSQPQTFAAVIDRLLDGYPVGAALDPLNRRYGELAARLTELLDRPDTNSIDPYELARQWTATIDARNWILIGDPAVRLMVSGLRPDLEGLKRLYRAESLRCDGNALAQQGDLEAAQSRYRAMLELTPWIVIDPLGEARTVSARARLRESRDLAKRGELEAAMAKLDEALELAPELGQACDPSGRGLPTPYLIQGAQSLAEKGRLDEARAALERVQELDPLAVEDIESLLSPALARFHRKEGRRLAEEEGNLSPALDHYEKALAMDPGLKSEFLTHTQDQDAPPLIPLVEAKGFAARYFETKGEDLARKGDLEQAVAAFARARELNPSLPGNPRETLERLVAELGGTAPGPPSGGSA